VKHISDTATHSRCKVSSGFAENNHTATGHVLAGVITNTFHDRPHARVSHTESLAGLTADEGLAGGSAVEGDVPDNDVILRFERGFAIRIDDQLPSGKTLAEVVVGFAFQLKAQTRCDECAKALARGAFE